MSECSCMVANFYLLLDLLADLGHEWLYHHGHECDNVGTECKYGPRPLPAGLMWCENTIP